MADDKTKRGSPDSTRLNKSEAYEVAYARKKANAGNTPRKATARRGSARAPAAPVARKRAGPKPTVRRTRRHKRRRPRIPRRGR